MASIGLTTVEQVRGYLVGVGEDVPAVHDTLVAFLVQAVSTNVEEFCRRAFGRATYTSEQHTGITGQQHLYLMQWPIFTITTVTLDDTAVTEGTLDANYRKIKDHRGDVVTLFRADAWKSDSYGISATYQAGYVLPGIVEYLFTAAAATDVFTAPGHALANGDAVAFRGATLPGGIVAGTIYYVRDVSGTTFKVSATLGGVAINLTTDGSGWIFKSTPETLPGRTLPYDLERAVVELVVGAYLQRGKAGLTRESFEGLSVDFDRWPLHILKVLSKYRRPVL